MRSGGEPIWGLGARERDDRVLREPRLLEPSSRSTASSGQLRTRRRRTGDSGGGLFAKNGGSWHLAACSSRLHPSMASPRARLSTEPDLARSTSSSIAVAILAVTTRPACNDGIEDDGDGAHRLPERPGLRRAPTISTSARRAGVRRRRRQRRRRLIDFPAIRAARRRSTRPRPALSIRTATGAGQSRQLPYEPNPTQSDVGGLGGRTPDGHRRRLPVRRCER